MFVIDVMRICLPLKPTKRKTKIHILIQLHVQYETDDMNKTKPKNGRRDFKMTNLEIARVFGEEESFKQNVMENLINSDGNISIGYLIYAEDHEPLTEEQQKVWDEYSSCGEIELHVDINLEELLG